MESFEVYQHTIWNEGATHPLRIPVLVVANTPDATLQANVRRNGALDLPWLAQKPAHDRTAVIVGGGPSAEDYIDVLIAHLRCKNTDVFAINGAAQWLSDLCDAYDKRTEHTWEHPDDITPWPAYQVTCDAKSETATLITEDVNKGHILASQCAPETIDAALTATAEAGYGECTKLFHMIMDGVEDLLPEERVKKGGYALIGGGASSGNTCMAIAYTMGYREIHCYGFDSSHRAGRSHAYDQAMNALIPTMDVEWAGKRFQSSVAMKAQAEKFMVTAQRLQQMGCDIHVHGEGLLPTMWHTPAEDLSEQHKYQRMWMEPAYRNYSPAETISDQIASFLPPESVVLDLGCGTARAALKLSEMGHRVTCVDFAENARDKEAAHLPFLQWDLSKPIPLRAPFGYCCDVMEHIPPYQVETVLANISEAVDTCLFRIEFEPDIFGETILGTPLHLSLHNADWWAEALGRHFLAVETKDHGFFIGRN